MRDVKYPRLHRLRNQVMHPLALAKFKWDRLCWQDAVFVGLLVRAALIAVSVVVVVVFALV